LKKFDCRIAVRLEQLEMEKLEQLIFERKFKNISQAIRAALAEFLSKREV
jgi:Arc/MetJ-type ribon-helix-helix transcriptional regulator